MPATINRTLLMSGAQFMTNASPINAHMHADEPFNSALAIEQHGRIVAALRNAGAEIISVPPPINCQDGIFTANWALTRGKKAVMSSLPTVRKPEEAYARQALEKLGFEITILPEHIRFSGQGDALPCGQYVFMGTNYRTDVAAHDAVAKTLGYKVISVQAIPELDQQGLPVINHETGWPDSQFYDLDLAIAVLRAPNAQDKGLIAWCPQALQPQSQDLIRSLEFVDKIEVSFEEALRASACNLVSTGEHVVMNANAPRLKADVEAHGLAVTVLHNEELLKNGGSVRCTSLTLDND